MRSKVNHVSAASCEERHVEETLHVRSLMQDLLRACVGIVPDSTCAIHIYLESVPPGVVGRTILV